MGKGRKEEPEVHFALSRTSCGPAAVPSREGCYQHLPNQSKVDRPGGLGAKSTPPPSGVDFAH